MRELFEGTVNVARDYRAQLQDQAQYIERVIPLPTSKEHKERFAATVNDYMDHVQYKEHTVLGQAAALLDRNREEDAGVFEFQDTITATTIPEFLTLLIESTGNNLGVPVEMGWETGYAFFDMTKDIQVFLSRADFRKSRREVKQDMSELESLSKKILSTLSGQDMLDVLESQTDTYELFILVSAGSLSSYTEQKEYARQQKAQVDKTPIAVYQEDTPDLEDEFGSRPAKS